MKGYEVYCLADPLFYDEPTQAPAREPDFADAHRALDEDWQRATIDDWVMFSPVGIELPPQGWKIHASACLDNAERVVGVVAGYCMSRRIPFKFIPSRRLLLIRNLKYAHRGSSGKLVTIYPRDEKQFEQILAELGPLLEGEHGPYILSDLRIGSGPLYVRYGGFAERFCIGPSGVQELAIADAEGRLVPDRRGATFQLPEWLEAPACLQEHIAARGAVKVDELPYSIENALHFSNGGGVYAGTDRASGARVVLKEARPHAGLAVDGSDAVARLGRERDALARLRGLGVVPELHDYFVAGEHHFLVEERIEGDSVHTCLAKRSPLVLQQLHADAAHDYAVWAMALCHRVEAAVAAVHERGMAIMDIHPSNILVGEDDRVVLIDLEMARDAEERATQTLADPAFLAPEGAAGLDVDRHALACLRLYVFMPLTSLFGLDRGKARHLAQEIAGLFPVARDFLAEAADVIAGDGDGMPSSDSARGVVPLRLEPSPLGWEAARASMSAAILESASPQRTDRLFPGDVEQFHSGGLNIAHGAAGVLYALDATGAGRFPEHEEWLVRHSLDPRGGTRLGLYDGLHGVAWVLDHLGRRADALAVLERCQLESRGRLEHFGLDLRGGLSGIGLNLLHFAAQTDDRALWDAATEVVDLVLERLGDEDSVATTSGGDHPYAGLIRGSSGVAMLLMRMYDHVGEPHLLEQAAIAIRQDLRRCVIRPEDGALEVDEGWRSCPYVADGGVGIGFALQDYLARRHEDDFVVALDRVRRSAEAQLYIEPGLFYGRAGMLLFLSRTHAPGTAAQVDPVAAAQVRRLAWHAVAYRGHMAFPGEQLLRLSMDLASGTAGVLLAVGAALHDKPVHLPLLEGAPPLAAPAEPALAAGSEVG